MERKIGEKFKDPEFGWCVVKETKAPTCNNCVGDIGNCIPLRDRQGQCARSLRTDKKPVIFAKTTPPKPAAKKPAKPAPSCTCPHCGGALNVVAA